MPGNIPFSNAAAKTKGVIAVPAGRRPAARDRIGYARNRGRPRAQEYRRCVVENDDRALQIVGHRRVGLLGRALRNVAAYSLGRVFVIRMLFRAIKV